MSDKEQAITDEINNLIMLSDDIIRQFIDVDMTADNTKLLDDALKCHAKRDNAIRAFFSRYSTQDFQHCKSSIELFVEKDKKLLDTCTDIKANMAKQVIVQRRNKLAAKTYQNI